MHPRTLDLRNPEKTCWLLENPGNYLEMRSPGSHRGKSQDSPASIWGYSASGRASLVAGTTRAGHLTLACGTLQEAGSSGQRGPRATILKTHLCYPTSANQATVSKTALSAADSCSNSGACGGKSSPTEICIWPCLKSSMGQRDMLGQDGPDRVGSLSSSHWEMGPDPLSSASSPSGIRGITVKIWRLFHSVSHSQ